MVINSLIAFFIFSFKASIVYIINDINDIEKDKLHPIKKNRPLASEEISKKNAIITAEPIPPSCAGPLNNINTYIKASKRTAPATEQSNLFYH